MKVIELYAIQEGKHNRISIAIMIFLKSEETEGYKRIKLSMGHLRLKHGG